MAPKTTYDFLQLIESDSPPSGFSETTRHTDRPAPLLLESLSRFSGKKGSAAAEGDEVHATKERPDDDSVSLSVSIEEKGSAAAEGDEVHATKECPPRRRGEVLWPVEQRSITAYYTPYTFSAKERDLETGYSYFGARYYSSDISVWLSVDPMSDDRSWLSPYNYCQSKPIIMYDPSGKLDGWIEDKDGNVSWDNSTNSQEEFNKNYKDREGYKYVSDPSKPNSYTLPNGDGRIVMNYWWEAKPESGIGMVGISMEFFPKQANSESGWTQTYLSNVPYVDSETLYRTLPNEIAEERLDGHGVVGETDVTKSAYFDSPKSNKLEDMPVRAKLPDAKYNVIMTLQSSIIVNGVKSFSIGWGFEITGDNSAKSFAPTILKSNTNFHNQAVNNLINR